MTISLICGVVGFTIATIAAPAVDDWLRRRRIARAELSRVGGVVRVDAPRFDRPRRVDPSPRRRGAA